MVTPAVAFPPARLAFAGLLCALFSAATGCSRHAALAAPAAALTPPKRLCGAADGAACRSVRQLEEALSGGSTILGMSDPPSGSQGAKVLTLQVRVGGRRAVLRAKWRPESSADLINEPRKELASYAVQKLFLDDDAVVAPPTVAHCFPLAGYRAFAADAQPTFPGIDCVFGFASYWLEGVETVSAARKDGRLAPGEGILDAERFERDSVYRLSLANANLLTYVINHGDAHNEQFLLASTPHGLRAFVVDNSIAFLSIHNPMLLFREDWSEIRVPRLPKRAIERLRQLRDEDYARLGTIAEFERDGARLTSVTSNHTPEPSDGSAMSWRGTRLRIGLTKNEIELVRSRIQKLLERPDLDQLAVL